MPKGTLRPPTPLPTRSEYMGKTYPEAMAGGGGKKPPKKPPTKTGGIPDKPEEPKKPIPYEREDREDRYKNGWYN